MTNARRCPFLLLRAVLFFVLFVVFVDQHALADLPIHPVSPEAVRAYLDGTLTERMDLIDLEHQLRDLSLTTLSSAEVEIWRGLCMELLTYPGELPDTVWRRDQDSRISDRSMPPQPIIEGFADHHSLSKEESLRAIAIDALFRLSDPSNDPGLIDLIHNPDVHYYHRVAIWGLLHTLWGVEGLKRPPETIITPTIATAEGIDNSRSLVEQ